MDNNIHTPLISYYFRTPHDIANGLMCVGRLSQDSVALFDMGYKSDHWFYMKNTLIPLDIIFIDENGVVIGTLENMQPLDVTPKNIGMPSLYVIEAHAGYVKRNNIRTNVTCISLPLISI